MAPSLLQSLPVLPLIFLLTNSGLPIYISIFSKGQRESSSHSLLQQPSVEGECRIYKKQIIKKKILAIG